MPGAVNVSVQIVVQIVFIPFTVAPFPEDCRPLLPEIVSAFVTPALQLQNIFSDSNLLIAAKKGALLLSCFSGGGQCD